jgi:hypothetical protein
MGGMQGVTGNLPGHVLPGLLLLFWSLTWVIAIRRDSGTARQRPLERSRAIPFIKILVGPVGVVVHIPPSTWSAMSKAMAWQHASMFVAFSLSGVVDLLVERGRLDVRASLIAFAGAMGIGALLLVGHENPGGLESTSHMLLALTFSCCAATAILELLQPSSMARWLRSGALLLAALWMLTTSWVLFLSGWELDDPSRRMWLFTLFAANTFIAATVLIWAAITRRTPLSSP